MHKSENVVAGWRAAFLCAPTLPLNHVAYIANLPGVSKTGVFVEL